MLDAEHKCFTEETEVITDEGMVPISEIGIGDKVLSYDAESGTTDLKTVTGLFQREIDQILEIVIGDETIRIVADHPFYTSGAEWVEAVGLLAGMEVRGHNGSLLLISSVGVIDGNFTVYDFEVDEFGTYLVTEDGILVHNCDAPHPGKLKRIGKDLIKRMKKKGVDLEDLKGGKRTGGRDIFSDENGDLWEFPKNGKGPGNPLGFNIRDFFD